MERRVHNRADAMASFRQDIVDAMVAASGKFDDRIAELQRERAALDERLAAVNGIEGARAEVQRLEEIAKRTREELSTMIAEVERDRASNAAEQQRLADLSAALSKKETELRDRQAALEHAERALAQKTARATEVFEQRELELQEQSRQLAAELQKVADLRQRLVSGVQAFSAVDA